MISGCATAPKPGQFEPRSGDEIIVAGRYVHTTTPVVLWTDPGGYDAYRIERRFSTIDKSDWESSRLENKNLDTPNRYDTRRGLSPALAEKVHGGGWDLPALQNVIDQFVIHYDATGTSRACFRTLHDTRDLSAHFLLDLDGTIYQTLDVKERARHATIANDRSIGIEIANIGAYEPGDEKALEEWYQPGSNGFAQITIPERFGPNSQRDTNFTGSPAQPGVIVGQIQGKTLRQYDFTPQQYQALIRLTATLCVVFPKIKCDYPRDASGKIATEALSSSALFHYQGILGHYHIQTNKVDPGPAFQWDTLVNSARALNGMPKARSAENLIH